MLKYISILNKILGMIYVIWMSLLLYYIMVVTTKNIDKTKKESVKILQILNWFLILILFILPINIYYDPVNHLSNSYGSAIDFLYLVCFVYLSIMVIIVLKNHKNEKLRGKLVPFYVLFGLFALSLVIRFLILVFSSHS